jgi:aminopeptidase YwaD
MLPDRLDARPPALEQGSPGDVPAIRHKKENSLRTAFILLFLCWIPPLALAQPHHDLLDARTRDLLHEALSGENAKEHVIQITRFNRVQASRGYRSAAQYVLAQLRSFGFDEKDAYIESFPSDGIIDYQTWQSPSGWDITSAELRMVEPYDERIVGYPEIGMSLITYSNPGDATAELVWVGSGTRDEDYAGKDVAGKFVLATGYGGEVHQQAVIKRGARAVVCYLDDARALEHPDMLQYTGMWPRADELKKVTFGFNLTRHQGEKLRTLLASGQRVVLHGDVKGKGLEPFFMDIVVAHIHGAGSDGKELVLSAHLDHPKESANDNASGSGAILDMARAMKEVIASGRLARPQHSIRFLWVPEWNGTMAYLDKHTELLGPSLGGKFLANVNMDMVGENLELLHSQLIITRTPDSMPSILDDVVQNMTEMTDGMNIRTPRGSQSAPNYRIVPYGGGSDHMMFIDRKIPGIMMVHSDYTHHTSDDTPDKVDPAELERCQMIGASTVWFLASLDQGRAEDLLYLSTEQALARLTAAGRSAHFLLATSDSLTYEATNLFRQTLRRENERLASILTFYQSSRLGSAVKASQALLEEVSRSLAGGLPPAAGGRSENASADQRVPVRLTRGPLDFGLPQNGLSEQDRAWYQTKEFVLGGEERFELVNFIDGRRTVAEIRDLLSAEFKPIAEKVVGRYIDDLVKVGVARWGKGQ